MWPDKDLLQTAHHEAGHAVAMVKLEVPFWRIFLSEKESMVEGTVHQGLEEVDLFPPRDLEAAEKLTWDPSAQLLIRKTLVTLAAGPISQMRYEQEPPPYDRKRFHLFGGAGDAANIRDYALGLAVLNSRDPASVMEKRSDLLEQTMEGASRLVEDHWGLITALGTHLYRVGEMNHEEVMDILAAAEEEDSGGANP